MQRDLTRGNVLHNLLLFSIPYLLSCFLQTFYGLADLFITGRFNGAAAISAVSIGSQVTHMLTVVVVGLTMGTTVMISRAVGSKDKTLAARAIGGTVLLFTAAVAISVVNLVTGNFIHSINAMQALMQTVMGSSVAVSFLNGIIDMLEGMNSMILLAAGLVLNIPGILMCLGLWLMFAQTKRSEGEVSTSGCTLVKVMVVLQFIAVCLVMTAGLIISVAFVVAAGASSSLTSIIVGVVMLLVMILISTLAICSMCSCCLESK